MLKRLLECLPYIFRGGYPPSTKDIPSPRVLIKHSDVLYDKAIGEVRVKGFNAKPLISTVEDTNSMDPLIDKGHICIFSTDFKHEDLAIGDIVCYKAGTIYILHRIVKIIQDAFGRIYTLRGDNTSGNDPYYIRDENILYLLRAVIY